MKYISKYKGFGLIEVLVALVIVAIGLLALASFQSQLMLNSGDNKARSEARGLAEAKIEELRDSIEIDNASDTGYTDRADLTAGTFSDTTSGTNANFSRAWTVADIAAFGSSTVPPRKTISVIVTWGAASAEETVSIVSEIAWIDPAKSLLSAEIESGSGATAQPSPRQNASEDVASETVKDSVSDGSDSDISIDVTETPGVDLTVTLAYIENSSDATQNHTAVTITQIASGSHYYATDDSSLFFVDVGVIAVFICDGVIGSATCSLIQNHFGGVVQRIRGTVSSMSGELLDDILVAWSSSDVNACYQDSASLYTSTTVSKTGYNGNSTTLHTMNYECVFAGNCDATGTSDGIGSGNGCSTAVTDAQIASRNVGPGGEFGELGLLGVDDRGGDREQLCFLEDTADHSLAQNVMTNVAASGDQYDDDYALPVTKRSYVARRRNNDDTQTSEGINQSYTNHNFLILDRANGGGVSETCADLVALNSANLDFEVAPREIIRTLSSTNTVASEITYAGGTGPAITLTGTASSSAELNLYVSETHANNVESGSCYIKSNGLAYACIVPSSASTVAIEGSSSTVPSSSTTYSICTSGVSTVAPTLTSACAWSSDF